MKVVIEIINNKNFIGETSFYGKVYINNKWFKEVGSFPDFRSIMHGKER
jgi:hypothetical protein